MNIIIHTEKFGIMVTESRDYRGREQYVRLYGLDTEQHDTLQEAMEDFQRCLRHAMECEGLEL